MSWPRPLGASALFSLRQVNSRRGLLAGLLLGLAAAIKAPYALFGAGLAWAAGLPARARHPGPGRGAPS